MATNLKVIAVYDNGGKSLDRYTIVTNDIVSQHPFTKKYTYFALSASEAGAGVFMWVLCERGKHLGKKIQLSDLSEELQYKIKDALI